MKSQGGTLDVYYQVKKQDLKCWLQPYAVLFWKRRDKGDRKMMGGCQGLEEGGISGKQWSFREVKLFFMILLTVDTCHYKCVHF